MRADASELWLSANQRALAGELARLAVRLEAAAGRGTAESAAEPEPIQPPAAIHHLADLFSLTPGERDILLLAAGAELDSRLARLCGEAQGLNQPAAPTFSLALAALAAPHWSALHPNAPLRHYRLLRLQPGDLLTTSPLRVEERVLHYLTGIDALDLHLQGLLREVPRGASLTAAQLALAQRVAGELKQGSVLLTEASNATRRAIARQVAAAGGYRLFALKEADLPADPTERTELAALWRRDALLSNALLLVELADGPADPGSGARLEAFADTLGLPLLLAAAEPRPLALPGLRFDAVPAAARADLRRLHGQDGPTADHWARVVEHFPLDLDGATQLLAQGDPDTLWQTARENRRRALDGLAQRIVPAATWDDLVLPEDTRRIIHDIARQVRLRHRVHGDWGFAARGSRGLGVSALFVGPSGVGKTLAAEVLANDLALDLYRIDLAAVVSKYIGETEKNLSRIFNAAEESGAVLLFDEADALFGKRSEVRDSHDRYANLEVAYLLQRMEAYRGLAILTTNQRQALDDAFLRRLTFVVNFPFPAAKERAEIWRRAFPPAAPLGELDFGRLSRLAVAGGNIRNIALGAAFIAAERGEPIAMAHLAEAARGEYTKLERPLGDIDLGATP